MVQISYLTLNLLQREFLANDLKTWLFFLLPVLLMCLLAKKLVALFISLLPDKLKPDRLHASRLANFLTRYSAGFLIFVSVYLSAGRFLTLGSVWQTALHKLFQLSLLLFCVLLVNYSLVYWLGKRSQASVMDQGLNKFYAQVGQALVYFLGFSMALSLLGINIAAMITGLGIGGLAVSMAAKDSLSNLFAGIAIMSSRIFLPGDEIATDTVQGTVEQIGFRTTRIRDYEERINYVPNAKIAEGNVINLSQMTGRSVRFSFTVSRVEDQQLIEDLCADIREIVSVLPDVRQETIVVLAEAIHLQGLRILVQYKLADKDLARARKGKADLLGRIWSMLAARNLLAGPVWRPDDENDTP